MGVLILVLPGRVVRHGLLFLLGLAWILPIYLFLINAVSSSEEYARKERWAPPSHFALTDNISDAWTFAHLGEAIGSTLFYAVAGAALAVLIAALAAFALASLRVPHAFFWFMVIYAGTIFPFQMYLSPLYTMFVELESLQHPRRSPHLLHRHRRSLRHLRHPQPLHLDPARPHRSRPPGWRFRPRRLPPHLRPPLPQRLRDRLHPPVHLDLERSPLRSHPRPQRRDPADHGRSRRPPGPILPQRPPRRPRRRPPRLVADDCAVLRRPARVCARVADDGVAVSPHPQPLPLRRGRGAWISYDALLLRGVTMRADLTRRDTSSGRFRGTTEEVDESARQLRQRMTPAERVLWRVLRGHRLSGLGFRRQHPIGPFVADFSCPARLLVVELDGEIHEAQIEQDAARTEILQAFGWQVIRFPNARVFSDLPGILKEIQTAATQRPLAPGQIGYIRQNGCQE